MSLPPVDAVLAVWVGALTQSGVTVAVKLTNQSNGVRLAVLGPGGPFYSAVVGTVWNVAKLTVTGLAADTLYTFEVQINGITIRGAIGSFRTAPMGNASFVVAFSGDARTHSNAPVFDAIRASAPLMFLHLGDAHYENIASNTPTPFRAELERLQQLSRQARLYREVPTVYVWDDHDYGPNDADGSSASKAAAAAVYRERVPHYPLPDATSIYQTFDIGRVRFIITDQRSAASAKADADGASKTMLGTTQKAWFKNLLQNSAGYLIVWVCPRLFGGVATAGADHWGGFTTERAEIANHINTHCSGRVVVISADMHRLAIDDGANHDFLPGTGEPIRTFQAAPLDQTTPPYGGGTYSSGFFDNVGQFGTMQIADAGGSSLDVTWRGHNATGAVLTTHAFTVNL